MSLREGFDWVHWSSGTIFGGRGGDAGAVFMNTIASCKATVVQPSPQHRLGDKPKGSGCLGAGVFVKHLTSTVRDPLV